MNFSMKSIIFKLTVYNNYFKRFFFLLLYIIQQYLKNIIIYIFLFFNNHQIIIIFFRDYQIVVVGMLPGNDDRRAYIERWAIRFNGNVKSECFIDFRGFAEHANVDFYNERNVVRFSPIFPHCRQLQHFPMRNITRHTIK